ncbi:hypothetical protein [Flagellimonas sp.]|uniref:hypothetical protein n=1 Tax=Flagellimonas sp. TaxID=2058762 RepID=UPI003AB510C4
MEKGIDSDGKINQRALKEDVEKVEELDVVLNIFQDSDTNCRARFDFDFKNQDLLDGLEQLKNLRKLVFVVRSQPDEQMEVFKYKQLLNNECPKESNELGRSIFLSTISGMKELEEFYYHGLITDFGYKIKVKLEDGPELIKIGTANPYVGLSKYPKKETNIFDFEKDKFFSNTRTYGSVYSLFGNDTAGDVTGEGTEILASFELNNLTALEKIHLYHQDINIDLDNGSYPKELFIWKKRGVFKPEFYLYDSAFNNIEELYIDYNHWAMGGGEGKSLDLNSFYNLSKISYRFFVDGGLGEYSSEERSKLILNNMNNLGNDLQIKVMFEPRLDIELENLKNFDICLDSDITQEFLSENVEIIWEGGIEDYTLINLECD